MIGTVVRTRDCQAKARTYIEHHGEGHGEHEQDLPRGRQVRPAALFRGTGAVPLCRQSLSGDGFRVVRVEHRWVRSKLRAMICRGHGGRASRVRIQVGKGRRSYEHSIQEQVTLSETV